MLKNKQNFNGFKRIKSQNNFENNFFIIQLSNFYQKSHFKFVKETREVLNSINQIDFYYLKKAQRKN